MTIRRKTLLLAVLTPSVFVLGTWGFTQANPSYSLPTAMLAALQLFALNSGTVDGPVPWSLEIARWTALLLSGSAVLGVAKGLASDSVLRARLLIERLVPARILGAERCVVIGLGRKGIGLVNDLRSQPELEYRVLGIDRDPERVAMARDLGIDAMVADATAEETLGRLPWRRMPWLVLLMGGDEPNVTAALNIARLRGDADTKVAVHVPNLQLRNLIARQNALKERGFRLFNYYERLARRTLLTYPVEARRIPKAEHRAELHPLLGLQAVETAHEQVPHVFIRPSRDFTPALMASLARSAHFPHSARRPWSRIRVYLVDVDAELRAAAVQQLYPALKRRGEYALVDFDTIIPGPGESPAQAIAKAIRDLPAGTPTTVFLDVHEPGEALIESLTILDGLGVTASDKEVSPDLDLRCIFDYTEQSGITAFIDAHPALGRLLRPLPSMADCCGGKVLFDAEDQMDALARTIHAQYDSTNAQPWDTLSLELQESNRAAADHVAIVMRYLLESGRDLRAPGFEWDAAELEALAECEHRRWAAQKLMAGWEPDASLGEGQNKTRKLHGCLDRIYAELSEETKERDRANVRSIPELIRVAR